MAAHRVPGARRRVAAARDRLTVPAPESPLPETVSPEPIPSLAAVGVPGEQLAVSYMYDGEPTVIRELAAGTDPSSVDITLP